MSIDNIEFYFFIVTVNVYIHYIFAMHYSKHFAYIYLINAMPTYELGIIITPFPYVGKLRP